MLYVMNVLDVLKEVCFTNSLCRVCGVCVGVCGGVCVCVKLDESGVLI